MRKLAFYIAKDIKRKCKTYDFALFRKENSKQAAKQRLHKFYFEQKRVQNHNDTLHHKTAIMLTPTTQDLTAGRQQPEQKQTSEHTGVSLLNHLVSGHKTHSNVP